MAQESKIIETPVPLEAARSGPPLWEYKVVAVQGATTMNPAQLNDLGDRGWELVAVQRDETTVVIPPKPGIVTEGGSSRYAGTYYYFKRAK